MAGAVGDAAQVGGEHKMMPLPFHREAHIVRTVVRHLEGCDLEIRHLEGYLLEDRSMVFLDATGDVVAAQQAVEHPRCAIESEVAVVAQKIVAVSHMVAVVVRKQQRFHLAHGYAGGFEFFFDELRAYSGVYDDAAVAGA